MKKTEGPTVLVWVKDGKYAQWGQTEPTPDIRRASYYDTGEESEHRARVEGFRLVQRGYELIEVARSRVTR